MGTPSCQSEEHTPVADQWGIKTTRSLQPGVIASLPRFQSSLGSHPELPLALPSNVPANISLPASGWESRAGCRWDVRGEIQSKGWTAATQAPKTTPSQPPAAAVLRHRAPQQSSPWRAFTREHLYSATRRHSPRYREPGTTLWREQGSRGQWRSRPRPQSPALRRSLGASRRRRSAPAAPRARPAAWRRRAERAAAPARVTEAGSPGRASVQPRSQGSQWELLNRLSPSLFAEEQSPLAPRHPTPLTLRFAAAASPDPARLWAQLPRSAEPAVPTQPLGGC